MKIDVIGTAAEVSPERVKGRIACVVDVFRATSVISTAMANGARKIIPLTEIQDCIDLRESMLADSSHSDDDYNQKVLLAGERNTVIIEGFDLDNSPRAFTRDVVGGATIIMSTTNGTRALDSARDADALFVASLLDAEAACRAMGELSISNSVGGGDLDIVIICSGRHDRFTIEDALCAGKMVKFLERKYGATITDLAWVVRDLYDRYCGDLRQALSHCQHYNTIVSGGLGKDVDYCLQQDIFDTHVRMF